MEDQASKLRNLINNKNNKVKNDLKKIKNKLIFFIASNDYKFDNEIIMHIGLNLSKNKNVTIIEDNINYLDRKIVFEDISNYSLLDITEYNKNIEDIIHYKHNNLIIINGVKDLFKLYHMKDKVLFDKFSKKFKKLDEISDLVLINFSVNFDDSKISLLNSSNEVILFVTSASYSLTEAYLIIKSLIDKQDKFDIPKVYIIIGFIDNNDNAYAIYKKLFNVCMKFLNIKLYYLGTIFVGRNPICDKNNIYLDYKFECEIIEISNKIDYNIQFSNMSVNNIHTFVDKLNNKIFA